MKQFFKFTFASMVGFVLAAVILGYIIVASLSTVAESYEKKEVSVKSNSVLHIELNYPINERTIKTPFAMFDGKQIKQLGTNDILKSIKSAKTDDKIKGIYLDLSVVIAGYANLTEIRNALLDFKTSGKFIYAYADYYIQSSYYLASVADKVFLTPSGELFFNGVQANVTFFSGTLDKIGVKMQAIKHGKYKGAVESFTLNSLSEPNREQLTVLLTSLYDKYLQDIGESRGVSRDSLFTIADELLIQSADDAVKFGLVDKLYYKDQVMKEIADKVSVTNVEDIVMIKLHNYATTVKDKYNVNKIAVVYGQGEIGMGKADEESIGSETMSKAIRDARNDKNVKAIVIRINSPGGSSLASDIIWREVMLAKEVKPVIISMSDLAASGGYYIACAGDYIVAQPNTITGSIGVFAMLPNAEGLLKDKLGLNFEKIKITKHADFGSIDRPMTDFEATVLQKGVDSTYMEFITRVANGRNLTVNFVDSVAQGRVWAGVDALKIGLVDELGGIDRAIAIAAEKAEITEYQIKEFPKQKDPLQELLEDLGMNASLKESIIKQELGIEIYQRYRQVKSAVQMKGMQMRMPFNLIIE